LAHINGLLAVLLWRPLMHYTPSVRLSRICAI